MRKFNVGDIVRHNAPEGGAYTELNGMLFEMVKHVTKDSFVVIDVTALSKIDNNYGWTLNDGKRLGKYVYPENLELVVPSKREKQDVPRRDKPVPKEALSPQCRQLLTLLEAKGSTTALEAGGVYRIRSLPRRIADLKAAGYKIVRDLSKDTTGQRYARYYLVGHSQSVAA